LIILTIPILRTGLWGSLNDLGLNFARQKAAPIINLYKEYRQELLANPESKIFQSPILSENISRAEAAKFYGNSDPRFVFSNTDRNTVTSFARDLKKRFDIRREG